MQYTGQREVGNFLHLPGKLIVNVKLNLPKRSFPNISSMSEMTVLLWEHYDFKQAVVMPMHTIVLYWIMIVCCQVQLGDKFLRRMFENSKGNLNVFHSRGFIIVRWHVMCW